MSLASMPAPRRHAAYGFFSRLPYWLLVALLLGVLIVWRTLTNESYAVIFSAVSRGLGVTIYVTLVAYAGALVVGLFIGIARVSKNRILYEAATFYVEIIRGAPMLVLLLYIAFVGAPALVYAVNWLGEQLSFLGPAARPLLEFRVRDFDFTTRAILALIIGYSAFLSEIFRAGIESIEHGQIEAAQSLGMSRWQVLRLVVLPQAIRRVLPPLGNDFIAMLKDSSLVSVLGVPDITQMGKVYAASTFLYFETYNIVAFLYLSMTIVLSLGVRWMEHRMPQNVR
ncbi:amino acid ABC transporter permease [Caldilinea sp.]|jgi:polar amino acid transport system permease protein|nr:amino acid ABC transporter permease [Caldilinea sp.]GIV71196.1 MAG: amino acid ABC transporter [Caldilinea sp.]